MIRLHVPQPLAKGGRLSKREEKQRRRSTLGQESLRGAAEKLFIYQLASPSSPRPSVFFFPLFFFWVRGPDEESGEGGGIQRGRKRLQRHDERQKAE